MGERITTDRALELLAGATLGPWLLPYDDGAITANGDESLLGLDNDGMAIVWERANALLIAAAPDLAADLIDARAENEALQAAAVCICCGTREPGVDEDGCCGCGGDVIGGSLGMVEAVEALRADLDARDAELLAARAKIAALTAAQGVPVEVHARAVREAMSAGYTDGDNYTTHNRESVWDEVRAVLTRCVGADRALALVDGDADARGGA